LGDGSRTDALNNGDSTSISVEEETATITVISVNDPPTGTITGISTITEDTTYVMSPRFTVADVEDADITLTFTTSAGTFSGVPDGAAYGVVETVVDTDEIKYVGSAADLDSYFSATSLTFQPTLHLNGTGSGIFNATLSDDPTDDAREVTLPTKSVNITAVNDAPVLDISTSNSETIAENSGDDDGSGADGDDDDISNNNNDGRVHRGVLVNDSISDPDLSGSGVYESFAVIEIDNRNGVWQYREDFRSGTPVIPSARNEDWKALKAGTASSTLANTSAEARLVGYDTARYTDMYIRFVPNENYVGAATIKYRAWQQGYGDTPRGTANTTTNGGSSLFSAAVGTYTVNVYDLKYAPVLSDLAGDSLTFYKDQPAQVIDQGTVLSLTDRDDTSYSGGDLTVSVVTNEIAAEDLLGLVTSGDVSLAGTTAGSAVSFDGIAVGTLGNSLSAGNDLVINFGAAATAATTQALLRAVTYRNIDPVTDPQPTRTVRFVVDDGDTGVTENIDTTVNVIAFNNDGGLSAASGVSEPAGLSTDRDTSAEALEVFDFTLTDGAGGDGAAIGLGTISLDVSGTSTDTHRSRITWLLNGPDVTNRTGSYNSSSNRISFTGLSVSVADGASETYTVSAYFSDTTSIPAGRTAILSVGGSSSFGSASGTRMNTSDIVTNGTGMVFASTPTQLAFATDPAGVTSGAVMSTQPVVRAVDASGNLDTSFTEDVTISIASGAGTLAGTTTVVAVAGVASFTDLSYTAAVDGESFTLTANDEDDVDSDLTAAVSGSADAEVVATKLIFLRQPTPRTTVSGADLRFDEAAQMRIAAVGAGDVVDTDYTGLISVSEINGAGSALLFVSSDVSATISRNADDGIAEAWPSSGVYYTNNSTVPASVETFNFQASATGLTSAVSDSFSSVYPDSTGTLTAAPGVSEPVSIPTTAVSRDTAVAIFDFVISDGGVGASDGLPLTITDIRLRASGTTTDAERGRIFLMLNGPDLTNKQESYTSSSDTWHFDIDSFPIQVADGASETYTVSAYFPSSPTITEGATLILSVDADNGGDIEIHPMSTRMALTAPLVSDSVGSAVSVDATRLSFTTEPASSVSGEVFGRQPVVTALDATGNVDTDFIETVTISKKSGDGTLAGTLTATAVAGVATFTDLAYSALADGERFVLSVDDDAAVGADFAAVDSASTASDVVATKLAFATEPAPLTLVSGQEQTMTTVPVVHAVDADGILDTGYTTRVSLAEASGAGSATLSVTGDTDGSAATVRLAADAGIATFTDLKATYTASALLDETFVLRASSGSLTTADSATLTAEVPNSDGTLVAAPGVTEPVALDSTVDTAGEAVNLLDFTLTDGGGDDGLGIAVSALNVQVGGTSIDAERAQVTWRLSGAGITDVGGKTGTYDAANDRITFTGLGIDLPSGGSATYTVSAFYNDNTNLTDGSTFALSLSGSTDLTLVGTTVGSATAVTGTTPIQVVATRLSFTTMPAGTTAGAAFTTQPVVSAVDDFGNVDRDFTEAVTLSESSAGTIGGDVDVAAVAGVATFTGLSHKPAADGEALALIADDEGDLSVGTLSDLPSVTATAITSDVVATQLAFLDEPAPLNLVKARATDLSTVPRIGAVNADGIVDTDRTGTVVLTMVDGAGTAAMSATGDTDGDPGGSTTSITLPLTAGVAIFTGINLTYTNSGDANETFKLQASHPTAPSLATATTVKSAEMRGVVADTDGDVTAAAGVSEPVALDTTVDSTATPVALFDFTLSDGATVDSLPLEVTAIDINVSGTTSDAVRGQISWLLDGPDAAAVAGTYDAATDKIQFTGLTLSVASGGSEIYTLSARYSTTTGITDNQTLILSLDGDTDVTLAGTGTQFATTLEVTNGTGSVTGVTASQLVFSQQPAGSASGSALTTQPVMQAQDAAGNLDLDFTEAITLSTPSAGTLDRLVGGLASDVLTATASAGSATFTGIRYTATADKQAFTLQANDVDDTGSDLPRATSASVTSEVTATKLAFSVEPLPSGVTTGDAVIFGSGPRVAAVDEAGVRDVDVTVSVVLSEIGGGGTAVFELGTDTDLAESSVTLAMVAGEAAFDGTRMTYTASIETDETFYLRAAATGYTAVRSVEMSASPPPPPRDDTIRDKVDGTGKTTTDPEIEEGGELSGGEVCGTALSKGVIRDVTLCPGTVIKGGTVAGEITGDADEPARLEDTTILPGTKLKNVRVGADVILLKGVIIGENVGFDSLINVPAGVMLTDTLSKIAVPGSTAGDERVALDLRSTPLPGAAEAPRTSYLELVNETPEFSGTGSRLEQAVTGEVKMEFPTSESRMLPVGMRKTEDGANGFYYDDDGNLSIRMGINLEIIMYPMFTDEDAMARELRRYDSSYGIRYNEDSNFIIEKTLGDGSGADENASLPRYTGRPGISAFRAVRSRTPGFVFYPSPWLANLEQVSLITQTDAGTILEQELVPVPKDWFELKAQLLANPEVGYVRIDSYGVITIKYRGEEFNLLASYNITPNAVFAKEGREIVFIEAGDLNDDGELDYYSYYANGDRQTIYVFPQ
jgi:hypothetical protein